MNKWKPVDILIIAFGGVICFILVMIAIVPLITGTTLTEAKAKMVATIISSVLSIISMYVGAKIQQNKDNK